MRMSRLLFTTRRLMVAAVIAAISLLFVAITLTAAPPITPQTTQAATPAEVDVKRWEDRKARVREEVDYNEAYHRAKQAEARTAELRIAASASYKADLDRQKQKGYTSTFVVKQADIGLAECQSQYEMRLVELKDAEIRLARSRRRLKAIEHSDVPETPEPQLIIEDRFRDLEIKYEILRSEFDQVKRLVMKQG